MSIQEFVETLEEAAGKLDVNDPSTFSALQPGQKLTFTGERRAAAGAGDDASASFYFVSLKPYGVLLAKTKRSAMNDSPTHLLRPKHRMGLSAIVPAAASGKRPNAMTLGYLRDVKLG